MKEKSIINVSAACLTVGCTLGITGSIVPSATIRSLAWAADSAALIVAGALLTMFYFRKGYDIVASGFLIFALAETIVFSSCATDIDSNIASFGAGTLLWALSIATLSIQKVFPLFVRCAGIIASTLFAVVSVLIFTGHPVNPLTRPLPFFAYPFFAATLVGWAYTLLKLHSRSLSGASTVKR